MLRRAGYEWITTQYVRYFYKVDFPDHPHLSGRPDSLILVEQGTLVNAPPSGDAMSETPVFHARFTHYRYTVTSTPGQGGAPGTVTARLSHTFDPAHVERFAEKWATSLSGQTQAERMGSAAAELVALPLDAPVASGAGPEVVDLASKIVTYYGSGSVSDGYEAGHMAGMVQSETLLNGCGCAGSDGQDMRITFEYKRRLVHDHVIRWDDPDVEAAWGQPIEDVLGRWSRVTIRREYMRDPDDGAWKLHKTIKNWSEDRPFAINQALIQFVNSQALNLRILSTHFVWIPYITANAVIEGDGDGSVGRTWLTYHEFGEVNEPIRTYHATAVEEFNLVNDLPAYEADAENPINIRDAVTFKDGGLVDWMEYDSRARLLGSGVARTDANGQLNSLSRVQDTTYLAPDTSSITGNYRWDLVKDITRYPLPGNDFSREEKTDYDYELTNRTGQHRLVVEQVAERVDREIPSENGPGSHLSVESLTRYTPNGDIEWEIAPDGVRTVIIRDGSTGETTQVIRNADGVGNADPMASHRVVDALGRPLAVVDEQNVETRFEYGLGATELAGGEDPSPSPQIAPTRLEYFTLTVHPHEFAAGDGSTVYAGPRTVHWADAGYQLLRTSEYDAASGPETARTEHSYSLSGGHAATRTWHDIENNLSYLERFEHDALGRRARVVDANGEATSWSYDIFDRITEVRRTVGGQTQVLERRFYDHTGGLESPEQGVGGGNLTLVRRYVTPTDYRDELSVYDWRNRNRFTYIAAGSEGQAIEGSYAAIIYDNLDRPRERATIGGGDLAPLIDKLRGDELERFVPGVPLLTPIERVDELLYSARGLVYEERVKVYPNGITGVGTLENPTGMRTRRWFDDAAREIASIGAGGVATKTQYDGLGRVTRVVMTDGRAARENAGFAQATSLDPTNEIVYEEALTTYDDRGLAVMATTRRRRDDVPESVKGLGADPISLYSATVYDDAARPIAAATYGVDAAPGSDPHLPYSVGGAAPAQAPMAVPQRSDSVLVTETRYDPVGRPHESVDPKGRVSRLIHDDMGRVIATIDNATDAGIGVERDLMGLWSLVGYPTAAAPDENRVVSLVQDGVGNITHRIAHNMQPGGSDKRQVTRYIYRSDEMTQGAPPEFENLAVSNNMLFEVRYPARSGMLEGLPSSHPMDIERYGYNLLGERISRLDQNSTLFTYEHDGAGRIFAEEAVDHALGSYEHHPDFTISRIETDYDIFGRVERVRSKRDTAIANEVRNTWDFMGRLTKIEQSPIGRSDHPGGLEIELEYEPMTFYSLDNPGRLAAIVYPGEIDAGRTRIELHHGDSGSSDELISRVTGFSWQDHRGLTAPDNAVRHRYMGVGRRIRTEYETSGSMLTRDRAIDPDTGVRTHGVYHGLDRFGRVRRHVWALGSMEHPITSPHIVDLEYRYDRSGNITSRRDMRPGMDIAPWRHEAHDYDDLDRLTESVRGDALGSPETGSERWSLDRIGNWSMIERAGDALTGYDETESFTFNAANEIVAATPDAGAQKLFTYDNAGNLVRQRLVDELDGQGQVVREWRRAMEYDPWGRLTRVRLESRPPAGTWSVDKTLAAYTYYAGNQRATRTARSARSPDDVDDPSAADSPTERTLYYYDAAWRLLEEAQEESYAGPWSPTGHTDGAAFAQAPDWGGVRIVQHIWDPTGQDALVQSRTRPPLTGPGSGEAPDAWWALVDRRNDVVALVGVEPAPGVDGGPPRPRVLRVRYSSYGVPTLEPAAGDLTGDGAIGPADLALLGSLSGSQLGDASYRADADLNFDGVIDGDDLTLLTQRQGQASVHRGLWGSWAAGAGGADMEGAPLWLSVGYAGAFYDRATGLWLMRHRWYDAELGRWITRDPAGYVDGMNLYLYVGANPLAYWDPFGLARCMTDTRWHHLIPQAVKEFMPDGLNINDKEHGWLLKDADHRALHNAGWNDEWNNWMTLQQEKGVKLTPELVNKQKLAMAQKSKYADILARGGAANHGYSSWNKLKPDAKSTAFNNSRQNLQRELSRLDKAARTGVNVGKAVGRFAARASGVAVAVFVAADVASGEPLAKAVFDNAVIDSDIVIRITQSGQQILRDGIDDGRTGAQRNRRGTVGASDDPEIRRILGEVFSNERGPI